MDLTAVLRTIRERWFPALLLAVALCAPAAYWLLTRAPEYSATARLRVERSAEQVLEFKEVVDQNIDAHAIDSFVLTVVQELRSRALYTRVARDLTPAERTALLAAYADEEPAVPDDFSARDELQIGIVVRYLIQNTQVERDGRTLLVGVTVMHRDPAQAKFLADRIATTYVAQTREHTGASGANAADFIDEQVAQAKEELDRAARALQDYRDENHLVTLEDDQHLLTARLGVINHKLAETRVERMAVESRLAQARELGSNPAAAKALASLPEFAAFIALETQADALRLQRQSMAERFGPKHPRMLENAAALQTIAAQQQANMQAAFSDLDQQFARLRTQEADLLSHLAHTETEALRMDRVVAMHQNLERALTTRQEMYSELLDRQLQTRITRELPTTNVRLSELAVLPEEPSKPRTLKILVIFAVLGGSIFVGYPLAAGLMDQRMTHWDSADDEFGVPLVGEINRVSGVRKRNRARIVQLRSDESTVEAFRCLHSQLLIRSTTAGRKTVLVSSATPAEGKTFVASNLAACFAAHGTSTLLVDCDFRRPRLHEVLGNIRNDAGILPWLRKGAAVPESVASDATLGILGLANNLHFLRSGGHTREATEVLLGPRVPQLFEALQREYDLIIVDTPPAGVFSDADALARVADDLLFVCRYKASDRNHVRAVLSRLRCTDLGLSGIVLNAVPRSRSLAEVHSGFGYAGAYRYRSYYKAHRA